jgi:LPXTG-motif cell wall-anchored protein
MALSTLYIATLAAMDGSVRRRRTRALTLATAAVTAVAAMSLAAGAAFAQSAGDRQYADPLAGDDGAGGRQEPQQPPSGADDSPGTTATPPASAPAPSAGSATSADGSATLPRTGMESSPLVAVGLALLALGALGRPRGDRRAA